MSMIIVDLDVHIQSIEQKLGELKDETPKVLQSGLSNTARRVRKKVLAQAAERYVFQDKSVWKATNSGAIKVKSKTKRDKFYFPLISTGPMNELRKFMVSPDDYNPKNRPSAHTAKVLSSGSPTKLRKAPKPFIVKFSNGHIAVVRREKNDSGDTVLKSVLSPSIPTMVKNSGLEETANELIDDELPVQIQKAIQRTLKKAGKA